MTDAEKLAMLKLALDMRHADAQREAQLEQLLTVAASRIAQRGITLRDDLSDTQLQIDLAAWLFRRRNQTAGPAMPESLRHDLNDRLVAESGVNADG